MVAVRVAHLLVFAETVVFDIIIVVNTGAGPPVVTLDAEVVIRF